MALTDKLTEIANSIRKISNTTSLMTLDQIPSKIKDINDRYLKWVDYGNGKGALYNLDLSEFDNIRNYLFYGTELYNCIIKPKAIGIGAFSYSSIDSTTLLDLSNLESAGESSFSYCKISNFFAPNLLIVSEKMFLNSDATSIHLENAITIETNAINHCNFLTEFYAPNIKTIGIYGLANNDRIQEIDLPNVVTLEMGALRYNSLLQKINIPQVVSIPVSCFMYDTKLKRLNFYGTQIYSEAFKYCTSLVALVLHNPNIVNLRATDVFTGSAIYNGIGYIYVPDELVEDYKVAKNWSTYASRIKPISELPIGDE